MASVVCATQQPAAAHWSLPARQAEAVPITLAHLRLVKCEVVGVRGVHLRRLLLAPDAREEQGAAWRDAGCEQGLELREGARKYVGDLVVGLGLAVGVRARGRGLG